MVGEPDRHHPLRVGGYPGAPVLVVNGLKPPSKRLANPHFDDKMRRCGADGPAAWPAVGLNARRPAQDLRIGRPARMVRRLDRPGPRRAGSLTTAWGPRPRPAHRRNAGGRAAPGGPRRTLRTAIRRGPPSSPLRMVPPMPWRRRRAAGVGAPAAARPGRDRAALPAAEHPVPGRGQVAGRSDPAAHLAHRHDPGSPPPARV